MCGSLLLRKLCACYVTLRVKLMEQLKGDRKGGLHECFSIVCYQREGGLNTLINYEQHS